MIIKEWVVEAIDFYRNCSSCFRSRCRYVPSCSEYAREAVTELGLRRGLKLVLHRILRCHPLGGSGYDPVLACRQQRRDSSLRSE